MTARVSKYHGANVAVIRTLDPAVQPVFYELVRRIAFTGIYVRLTAGRRTAAEQNAEWAKGRLVPGPVVTDAKGDESYHVWGLAIDVAPLTKVGPFTFQTWYADVAYVRIAEIAAGLGIEWGKALWGKDAPHFQYSGGLTIAQLRKGQRVAVPPVVPMRYDDRVLARIEARFPL